MVASPRARQACPPPGGACQVAGVESPQGAEDFVKSMKPSWLGGNGQATALLHVRERSGIMACRGAAGEGA